MVGPSRVKAVVGALALSAVVVVGAGCGSFEKMPEGDVDGSQRDAAQRIATRIWDGCRTGRHEALSDAQAIKEMRDGLTPARMASTCASTRAQLGDFVSMEYAETWRPKAGPLRVYRFTGRFASTSEAPEIRVVMDGEKLSGFWLKPWSEALR